MRERGSSVITNQWWCIWRKLSNPSKEATNANAIPLRSGPSRAEKVRQVSMAGRWEKNSNGVCLKCFEKVHWRASYQNPWVCQRCHGTSHKENGCNQRHIGFPYKQIPSKQVNTNLFVSKQRSCTEVVLNVDGGALPSNKKSLR